MEVQTLNHAYCIKSPAYYCMKCWHQQNLETFQNRYSLCAAGRARAA